MYLSTLTFFVIGFSTSSHPRRVGCAAWTSRSKTQCVQKTSAVAQESLFLDQVEESILRILTRYGEANIQEIPPSEREALRVAQNLHGRLQTFANKKLCRRCWLPSTFCVCDQCVSLEDDSTKPIPKVRRLFLLTHHNEVLLKVDTAKLILCAFPKTCRLVVGGIPAEFQDSMYEMEKAIKHGNCLVLYPAEDARTFDEIERELEDEPVDGWDVIVIDGTWSQANKLHNRYLQNGPRHVQLSKAAVEKLASASKDDKAGHQLRHHPTKWREISTLEATRLFLGDMMSGNIDRPWDALANYQIIADATTQKVTGKYRHVSRIPSTDA